MRSLVDELSEDKEQDAKIVKSFYAKDTLSPDVFEQSNGTHRMIGSVREKLLSIADKFIDFLGVDFFIHDAVLTGSLANYNWSEYSDVDVHILIDYEESGHNQELLKEFFDAKKKMWNLSHDIMIKNYEVELYVQDVKEKHISSGVYSILNNKWLIEPQNSKQKIDDRQILQKGREYAEIIDTLIKRKTKGEEVTTEIDDVKKKIKRFRQSGLDKGGEFSYENLTFKLLRRNGYIEKLLNLKKQSVDKKFSVNEIQLDLMRGRVVQQYWDKPKEDELHYFTDTDDIVETWKIKKIHVSLLIDGTLICNKGDVNLIYGDKIQDFHDLDRAWDTLQDGLNRNRINKRSQLYHHNTDYVNNQTKQSTNESIIYEFVDRDVLRLEKEALKHYGETHTLRYAAYITPGGHLLDFSEGSGSRAQDHRNIGYLFDILGDIDIGEYGTDKWRNSTSWGMYAVMDMGFIRFMPESYGLDMHKMPTQNQFQVIRQIIRARDGEIIIEMDEEAYVEHESGTPEEYIIEGIKRYYNEGIKPKAMSNVEDEEFF